MILAPFIVFEQQWLPAQEAHLGRQQWLTRKMEKKLPIMLMAD
jgi:hypothetical protein